MKCANCYRLFIVTIQLSINVSVCWISFHFMRMWLWRCECVTVIFEHFLLLIQPLSHTIIFNLLDADSSVYRNLMRNLLLVFVPILFSAILTICFVLFPCTTQTEDPKLCEAQEHAEIELCGPWRVGRLANFANMLLLTVRWIVVGASATAAMPRHCRSCKSNVPNNSISQIYFAEY